ncbi:hypothetical protein P171DRAFT_190478 [Karstenula rhodostoma CBS 690.94]|uniref:Uncharacterized protein n=1 Tax=Karstenula rhodostoma CBS 690.94 TaxID=1392251 RepID=A0A9P4PU03_9PLEO|nr:hypothetical protein P171DRAFT_190478 [Karstenula rhodostoma CBS 690.94]
MRLGSARPLRIMSRRPRLVLGSSLSCCSAVVLGGGMWLVNVKREKYFESCQNRRTHY